MTSYKLHGKDRVGALHIQCVSQDHIDIYTGGRNGRVCILNILEEGEDLVLVKVADFKAYKNMEMIENIYNINGAYISVVY